MKVKLMLGACTSKPSRFQETLDQRADKIEIDVFKQAHFSLLQCSFPYIGLTFVNQCYCEVQFLASQ